MAPTKSTFLIIQQVKFRPSFSPDGSKILFDSDRSGVNQIYTMSVDGSNVQRITNNTTFDGRACYSPDGQQIALYLAT